MPIQRLFDMKMVLLMVFCAGLAVTVPAPASDAMNRSPSQPLSWHEDINDLHSASHQLERRDKVPVPDTRFLYNDTKILNQKHIPQLTCFSDKRAHCSTVDHRWPEVAIALFCQKIDGLVFNLNYQNTSVKFNYTYYPAPRIENHERGSIFIQVGFAPEADSTLAYTMDYQYCHDMLHVPLDHCDRGGVNGKRGGVLSNNPSVGNDHLFWVLDPNPIPQPPVPGSPQVAIYCNNKAYYWVPWDSNTVALDPVYATCMASQMEGSGVYGSGDMVWAPHFDCQDEFGFIVGVDPAH